MTIIDLHSPEQYPNKLSRDICIIGAGAAGIYLARRLADMGLSVVILEAGGQLCSDGCSVGIVANLMDSKYGGVHEGRAFGLGGTTSKWGGQLIPYSELDLRDRDSPVDNIWSHIATVAHKRGPVVESAFGLGSHFDYFTLSQKLFETAELLFTGNLSIVASQWLPFRQRNFRHLVEKSRKENITIVLHAVAANWKITPSVNGQASVTSVAALSSSKRSIEVSAHSYIIAAGAVESTRILLEIERQYPVSISHGKSNIGKFLSDHLSCAVAHIEQKDARKAISLFGPRFVRGVLRSFRFVLKTRSANVPRHFFHFIFDNKNPGFGLAKKILAGMQSRSIPEITGKEIVHGLLGISGLAYGRICKSRLYIPDNSPVYLYLDIEQTPNSGNFVSLGDSTDIYGRPNVIVNWKIREEDYEKIRKTSEIFFEKWPGNHCGIPSLKPNIDFGLEGKLYDAYHPVGTCRMGNDSDSVLDLALRVRGCNNLSVLSTAAFPTAGTANPTFSLLCLAEDMAERIARERRLNN